MSLAIDLLPGLKADQVEAAAAILGAVGTIGAVIVALWLPSRDRTTRQREAKEAQARCIAGWATSHLPGLSGYDPMQIAAEVSNASEEPVYRAMVWAVDTTGDGPKDGHEASRFRKPLPLRVIPPGRYSLVIPAPDGGHGQQPGLEVAFTDAAGRNWVRRADGTMEAVSKDPKEYYGLTGPLYWMTPTLGEVTRSLDIIPGRRTI